jgi:hypothetical protein
MFFDIGRDQLIAFLEPNDIPGVPAQYDAGINRCSRRLLSFCVRGGFPQMRWPKAR